MKVKSESEVAQSCPTLRDPMDGSPLGSSVHGIFQARVLGKMENLRGTSQVKSETGPINGGQRKTEEKGRHSRLIGVRFNKQQNIHKVCLE